MTTTGPMENRLYNEGQPGSIRAGNGRTWTYVLQSCCVFRTFKVPCTNDERVSTAAALRENRHIPCEDRTSSSILQRHDGPSRFVNSQRGFRPVTGTGYPTPPHPTNECIYIYIFDEASFTCWSWQCPGDFAMSYRVERETSTLLMMAATSHISPQIRERRMRGENTMNVLLAAGY